MSFAKLSGTLTLTLHGITETTLDLSCTDEEAVLRFKTIKGLTGDAPKPRRRKDTDAPLDLPDGDVRQGASSERLPHPVRTPGASDIGECL